MITLECANTGGEGNFRLMGVDKSDRPQELQVNTLVLCITKNIYVSSISVVYELTVR